jgi:hypothetical protein
VLRAERDMHGSFCRADPRKLIVAVDPDFRSLFPDTLPARKADMGMMIIHLLHLYLPRADSTSFIVIRRRADLVSLERPRRALDRERPRNLRMKPVEGTRGLSSPKDKKQQKLLVSRLRISRVNYPCPN